MKKRRIALAVTAVIALLMTAFLAGIGFTGVTGGYGGSVMNGIAFENSMKSDMAPVMSGSAPDMTYDGSYESAEDSFSDMDSYGDTDQKWIVTVRMSAETKDYDGFMSMADEAIKEQGGYVESSDESHTGGYRAYRRMSMTVRVPVENLDALLDSFGEGADITSKSRDMENVTLAYHDTETQKRALEIEQEQLLELLARAGTVDEIIQVRDRLSTLQYEIERLGTRLRTYDDKVEFATVNISVTEVLELSSQPAGFFERAFEGIKQNLRDIREFVLETLLWTVSHLPALLLIGCVIAAGTVLVRRRRRKKKSQE